MSRLAHHVRATTKRGGVKVGVVAAMLLVTAWASVGASPVGAAAAVADPGCATGSGIVTCTFTYNGTDGTDGSEQTWVVPAGVTTVTVAAAGAQGGGPLGGKGGEARSSISVTPGETLWVWVGGDGGVQPTGGPLPGPGGFNGGGFAIGANGGGASDVRQGADDLEHRVVVGGGGGGGKEVGVGGVGGGARGGDGTPGGLGPEDDGPFGGPGSGGSSTAGGPGGSGTVGTYFGDGSGAPGDLGVGGSNVGTGGGGGLYGGGGGGVCLESTFCPANFYSWGGAGGGSGYVPGGCATPVDPSATCTPGTTTGHGSVTVSYPAAPVTVCPAATPSGRFVRWVYLKVLFRCPDAGGEAYWAGRLDAGLSPSSFARQIDLSDENVVDNNVVPYVNETLHRTPTGAEVAAGAASIRTTSGDAHLLAGLLASDEYYAAVPGPNPQARDQAWLAAAYNFVLERDPDPSGAAYFSGVLGPNGSTEATRHRVVMALELSGENADGWIGAVYIAALGRAPDPSGAAYWHDWLVTSGFRTFRMWTDFLASPEGYALAQTQPNPPP